MFYDRQIKYLDYLENKERCKGAGFVKMEVWDKALHLTVQVSGLRQGDTFERDVFLLDEQREEKLGSIRLERGKGSLLLRNLNRASIGKTGISYDSLAGIRIPLGSGREIYGSFAKSEKAEVPKEPGESLTAAERTLPESGEVLEVLPDNSEAAEKEEDVCAGDTETVKAGPEDLKTLQKAVQTALGEREVEKEHMRLAESKWQQLSAVYPHIKPFRDERDYLSIGPADFVVLPEKYYRMANNSFLLHGYYNYEHLILTRVERRGRILYYVGVPGNFYDREKQVAVMFGFESFECKEEPARQGEFGYYLMRIEL